MNKNTKKLTMSALFAALTCVATFISIPSINGYIHIGDALVIITGILLGPVHGGLAAGIGSALTDLIKGYAVYVPATFIIKGLIAIVCYFIYHKATSKIKNIYIKTIIAGIFGAAAPFFPPLVCAVSMNAATPARTIPAITFFFISLSFLISDFYCI